MVKRCFGWAGVRRKADKCQRLIAKLQTEQQGSGETKQRKWHSVVETLSNSDSYHSGHHELMPGCLMQVSEPKEHLSVTSAIPVWEGSTASAAWPCQELKQGCKLTEVFCSLCECHTCDLECQYDYFRATSSEKNSSPFMLWYMSKEQKLSWCHRNLTNVSHRRKSACSSNFMEHYLPRTVCFCG